MTDLGPLNLTEAVVEGGEGMKACRDYGKALGETLGSYLLNQMTGCFV